MQHTALLCCFSNRSVAKVSFKMFSHLSGMLMLQKRQQPTMFLFCFRSNFNEKSRSLEFFCRKIFVYKTHPELAIIFDRNTGFREKKKKKKKKKKVRLVTERYGHMQNRNFSSFQYDRM